MKSFLDLSRFHKQVVAATADLLLLPLTFYIAISLRYEGMGTQLLNQYVWLIVAAPLISIPIFTKLGLYRAVIRFIDHKIVYAVVFGVSFSVIMLAAFAAFLKIETVSRAVFGIYPKIFCSIGIKGDSGHM